MVAILTVCAIIACVSGAVKIVQSFKTETVEQITGSGHGKGFWDFYSYSSVDSMTIKMERGGEYISKRLIPRIMTSPSAQIQKNKQDLIDYLEDLADFEGYTMKQAQKAINSVSFNAGEGKLFLYIFTFTPEQTQFGQGLTIETMRSEAHGIKMAQDWMLVNKISSNMLKLKNIAEIRYIPTGITPAKIVDAISIAFAPVALGLVKVPSGFLDAMKDAVAQAAKNPSELPVPFTPEQMKFATEQYDAMIKRQKERDQMAIDGIKEIGEGVAKLAPQK